MVLQYSGFSYPRRLTASLVNSCFTPRGSTISALPPVYSAARWQNSSSCAVFPKPKLSNKALRPPFSAHATASLWCGFRALFMRSLSTIKPLSVASSILLIKNSLYVISLIKEPDISLPRPEVLAPFVKFNHSYQASLDVSVLFRILRS